MKAQSPSKLNASNPNQQVNCSEGLPCNSIHSSRLPTFKFPHAATPNAVCIQQVEIVFALKNVHNLVHRIVTSTAATMQQPACPTS
jgi:hypothetical protein